MLYYYYQATDPNIAFLNWLVGVAHKADPNFYMVGECWASDGALNSYFASACDSFFRFSEATGGDSNFINMYYDKSVITDTTHLTSMESLITDCETAKKKFSFEMETSAWYLASFFFGAGCHSNWTTDSTGKFTAVDDTFNNTQGILAARAMQKLVKSTSHNSSSAAADFSAATPSAIVVSGTWAYNDVKTALGDNLGVAELPSFVGTDSKTYHLGSYSGFKLMIAGLEDISDGTISIDGEVVNDLQPKDRHISMVFQNYALYPHLTVFENIAFPLRLMRPRMSADEIYKRVTDVAEILGITPYLTRKPKALSGGQRQRVAIGRAMGSKRSIIGSRRGCRFRGSNGPQRPAKPTPTNSRSRPTMNGRTNASSIIKARRHRHSIFIRSKTK